MTKRHLISLQDLDDGTLRSLVDRGVWYAGGGAAKPLTGSTVGIHFRKTSTRTRTAFTVGALRLGANVVSYGPADLQTETGETIGDTAAVLSGMLDGFVTRTAAGMAELRTMARQHQMAIVNAMTSEEHPTQALADLVTMQLRFGRLDGLRVLYIGEGNNTAAALALTLPRFANTRLELRTPPGFGLEAPITAAARRMTTSTGGITERHDMTDLPTDVDVIYTTRWETTGTVKPSADWRSVFAPFQVDEGLWKTSPGAVFMHDLPANRGEEVTAAVLDGAASVAFEQAHHKLHSAMAALEWCIAGPEAYG